MDIAKFLISFVSLIVICLADNKPPEDTPANVKCHVCMGRDLDNCAGNSANCYGYCYKVVDKSEEHKVIVKGCTPQRGLSTSSEETDWAPTPHIKLYWATKEPKHVRGAAYFCNTDMCNSGSKLGDPKMVGIICLIVARFILHQ